MKRARGKSRRNATARAALTGSLAILATHEAGAQSADGLANTSSQKTTVESALQEIIVTATHRGTDISAIPYNISAYSGESLARAGVMDLAQLSQQVPGFDLQDRGARFASTSIPIIRGLNASDAERQGFVSEQMPIGRYIGESPTTGYFPIQDIQRVEVLRGPQGTLYGAGALGGAIRIIPNEPELNALSGSVTGSTDNTAHSSDIGYQGSGVVNVPLGTFAAFRVSAQYDHQAGFIDQRGIVARTGDPVVGVPILATPGDLANSGAVY